MIFYTFNNKTYYTYFELCAAYRSVCGMLPFGPKSTSEKGIVKYLHF